VFKEGFLEEVSDQTSVSIPFLLHLSLMFNPFLLYLLGPSKYVPENYIFEQAELPLFPKRGDHA
jgi:hypothetical protein